MPLRILGLSAYYHDSAAALLVDGEVVAAAQEERFSRLKHDASFPQQAVAFCLREAGITPADLDHVVFYDKPLLKFDRLLDTYLAYAPLGLRSYMRAMPLWLKTKLHLPREIRRALGGGYRGRIVFPRHHESHAACAFFASPFPEAAILTLDGVGEWDTATIGHGRDHTLRLLRTLEFPHSPGLLYSAFTYFCGFKVNSGEYKLMGLAPYGRPRFAGQIREHLLDLKEDGSFRLDLGYFNYAQGLTMTSRKFAQLFEGPPRRPEAPITERELDLAASIQQVTEEIVLRMARTARDLTGSPRLCLAGGVALNCVANGVLLRSGIFDDVWVPGPAGDAGGALGSALFVHHQLRENPRPPRVTDALHGCLLGPRFEPAAVQAWLEQQGVRHHHHADESALLAATVDAIVAGKVVGWFHGRMEFGPRALGARSILGDARHPEMQSRLNLRIKFRESFRPFAPAVLAEEAQQWFELDRESPYMLLVAPVREEHRLTLDEPQQQQQADPDLRRRVQVVRSTIPAVTHVDYSARVQTVDAGRHGRFHRLLTAMRDRTGCSVVINTSFNIRGEPIVCTPEEAFRCFQVTDMDVLVLEDCILYKEEQPPVADADRQKYLASVASD